MAESLASLSEAHGVSDLMVNISLIVPVFVISLCMAICSYFYMNIHRKNKVHDSVGRHNTNTDLHCTNIAILPGDLKEAKKLNEAGFGSIIAGKFLT